MSTLANLFKWRVALKITACLFALSILNSANALAVGKSDDLPVRFEIRAFFDDLNPPNFPIRYLKVALFDGKGSELRVFEKSRYQLHDEVFVVDSFVVSKDLAKSLAVSVSYRNSGQKEPVVLGYRLKNSSLDSQLVVSLTFVVDSSVTMLQNFDVGHWVSKKSSGCTIKATKLRGSNGHPVFEVSTKGNRVWHGYGWSYALMGLTYMRQGSEWIFFQGEGFCSSGGWQETEISKSKPAFVNDLDYYSRDSLPSGNFQYRIPLYQTLNEDESKIHFAKKRATKFWEYNAILLSHVFTVK